MLELLERSLKFAARVVRRVRHAVCYALHGGHELYRARTDTRLFQECLLCGYETPGWTIDRRDRRMHLQAGTEPSGQVKKDARPQNVYTWPAASFKERKRLRA